MTQMVIYSNKGYLMNMVIDFIKDITKMEFKWIVWILCLIGVNIGGGLYFIDTLEGKLAVSFMLIGAGLMTYIHSKHGFVRLLGAGHILWVYLVPHFTILYLSLKPSHFKGWLFIVALLNGISLLIDIADVIRYFKGDKAPTIPVDAATQES